MTANSTADAGTTTRPKLKGLRWVIGLSLLAVFLFLLAIAALALWLRHEEILREGRRNAETVAGILAVHLTGRLNALEAALLQLADHDRRIGGPDASYELWLPALGTALSGLEGVESITVTDAAGMVTFSTRTELMGQSFAKQPIYDALSADPMSEALVAGTPSRSRVDSEMLVPFGRALRTTNGEFEGMLVAAVVPARLRSFYSAVDVAPNGIVWILDPNGRVFLREPTDRPLDEQAPDIPLEAVAADGTQQGTVVGPIEAGGPNYLTAYRGTKGTDLVVAVSLPIDDLLARWREEVAVASALVAIAGVLLALAGLVIERASRKAIMTPPPGQ